MSAIPKSDESILLREDRDGVCTLTLNRPAQMNLLTTEMLDALQESFDAISADRRVRVVVLAANGKGFCAGHDVKEIRALKELPKIEELFGKCSRMMQTITALPQPVIARVQGVAAAAGCQLVAQCDLAVASEAARFTTPGVTWGFFCSTPGVAVGRNISRKRAMEMLLTGEQVDAQKALEWGLVNRVVPAASLVAETQKLARERVGRSAGRERHDQGDRLRRERLPQGVLHNQRDYQGECGAQHGQRLGGGRFSMKASMPARPSSC
ncbi:MAG: enoyl-CoA hydratase, partial [Betaproteobacteria bacterium]